VLLNGGHGAAMAEWLGGFFNNCHSQLVKRHRLQWHVNMADFWPFAIFRHQQH